MCVQWLHVEMKEGTGPGRLPPGDHVIHHVFTLLLGRPSPVLYAENRCGRKNSTGF